jgi:hypothetical protein
MKQKVVQVTVDDPREVMECKPCGLFVTYSGRANARVF